MIQTIIHSFIQIFYIIQYNLLQMHVIICFQNVASESGFKNELECELQLRRQTNGLMPTPALTAACAK